MRLHKGKILIFLFTVITFNLWLASKGSLDEIGSSPLKSISQISALLGSFYLGIQLILISRLNIVEQIVGPLDKMYQYHKHLSIVSVIALITHGVSLIISVLPNSNLAGVYILPSSNNLTYASGIVALYLFILTISITIYLKIPYHIWKIMHRLIALATLLATYHVLTISSDISNSLLLRFWILGSLILGIIAMSYKGYLYTRLSKVHRYQINDIEIKSNVFTIKMEPIKTGLQYKEGQFAFFKFFSEGSTREEHPFSIVSNPNDRELKIAVKSLGDFTKKLGSLKVSEQVEVRGPHGGFSSNLGSYKKEIWVGAGIGITPLLSLTPSESTKIYYCTRNHEDAIFMEELMKKSSDDTEVVNYQSEFMGRFDPKSLLDELNKDSGIAVRVCGPEALIDAFKTMYFNNKLPAGNLYFEDFNFIE